MVQNYEYRMINQTLQIISSSAPIYKNNSYKNSIETEGLFGEQFLVLERKKQFIFGKLLTDNYEGWINIKLLGEYKNVTHRVLTPKTLIHIKPNVKSNIIIPLSIGSLVKVQEISRLWTSVVLPFNFSQRIGYIPSNHLVPIENNVEDWVNICEDMINIPYRWGGRGHLGIDCSALIQLSLQTVGINFPRDTKDQIIFCNKNGVKKDKLERGTLIFWEGHVALALRKNKIIHANSFHMKVATEIASVALSRIKKISCKPVEYISLEKFITLTKL